MEIVSFGVKCLYRVGATRCSQGSLFHCCKSYDLFLTLLYVHCSVAQSFYSRSLLVREEVSVVISR